MLIGAWWPLPGAKQALNCVYVARKMCVCARMFVCVCHFVLAVFYRESCLAFWHTKARTHTRIQHAQSPVGRRPRARPHIWQESNWACLMADIQERRRGKQTCSDEGERRAISTESWLFLTLSLFTSFTPSAQHYSKNQCYVRRQKSHDSSSFFCSFRSFFTVSLNQCSICSPNFSVFR